MRHYEIIILESSILFSETPKVSQNCPRANGYFPHSDKAICDQFFFCADGIGSKITCPEALVFSLKTGTCVWPDEAGRTDCKSNSKLRFFKFENGPLITTHFFLTFLRRFELYLPESKFRHCCVSPSLRR